MKPNKVVYFTKGEVPSSEEAGDIASLELLTVPNVQLVVASANANATYDPAVIGADHYVSQDGTTKADGYDDVTVKTLANTESDLGGLQLESGEAIATDEDTVTVTDQLGETADVVIAVNNAAIGGAELDEDYILVKLGTDIEAENGDKVKITLGETDEVIITFTPAT